MLSNDDVKAASAMSYYEERAAALLKAYEAVTFEDVHRDLLQLLPSTSGVALDVGAGSGRDAAWLARKGWRVFAVEPASALLAGARQVHGELGIDWVNDSLPRLESVRALRMHFNVILLSAVWMHVPPLQEATAFETILTLLANPGLLNITLRMGGASDARGFFRTDPEALKQRARARGLHLASESTTDDALGRSNVLWRSLVFRQESSVLFSEMSKGALD